MKQNLHKINQWSTCFVGHNKRCYELEEVSMSRSYFLGKYTYPHKCVGSSLVSFKANTNKKVISHDRMRHRARCLASTHSPVLAKVPLPPSWVGPQSWDSIMDRTSDRTRGTPSTPWKGPRTRDWGIPPDRHTPVKTLPSPSSGFGR